MGSGVRGGAQFSVKRTFKEREGSTGVGRRPMTMMSSQVAAEFRESERSCRRMREILTAGEEKMSTSGLD